MLLTGCKSTQTLPAAISLSPNVPQVLNQAMALTVSAVVSNDPSKKGVTWSLSPNVGSMIYQTSTSTTYQAPDNVTKNFIVTLTATSVANPIETAPLVITVVAQGQQNVQPIAVDGGPNPNQPNLNVPYTSVLICAPGTSNCQTIDGILVDTGSVGLRIFRSELSIPLQPINLSGGSLNACASFANMQFLWGQVAPADVYLAGERASGISVQLIGDPTEFSIPGSCSNGGTDANSQQVFPGNGILGVGDEPTDCTASGVNYCDPNSVSNPPPKYFVCFGSQGCAPTLLSKVQQLANPVAAFTTDNNGEIVEFPPVGTAMATIAGTMTFGINTQSNNGLGSATVFAIDTHNFFTTVFGGQDLTKSYIDSGSNELFFPNIPGIQLCSDGSSFCPANPPALLSAMNEGANNVGTGTVNFQVDNYQTDIENNPGATAFGYIAASGGTSSCQNGEGECTFDWGLPFFYGRRVLTSIDLETVANEPKTPWWAY
jgi:hypothetical protein